jgi:hypothetical protein
MINKPVQQKPDPAIGRNIRQARRGKPGDKAKGLVVAVSLATTLMGWGIFAHEDAQTAALQAAAATQVAAVAQEISTPQSTGAVATATATAVPIVTVNAGTGSDQSSSATTAATSQSSSMTTAASTSQSSSSTTSQVVAVARTQSSR